MSQENIDNAVAHLAAARTHVASGGTQRGPLEVALEAAQAAVSDIEAALADPELEAAPADVPVDAVPVDEPPAAPAE